MLGGALTWRELALIADPRGLPHRGPRVTDPIAVRREDVPSPFPDFQSAEVPPEKITGYLLSSSHRTGRHKALFFRALGFRLEAIPSFAGALRQHAISASSRRITISPYGTKYVLRGTFDGPGGRRATVVSVWIVPHGSSRPRLVTAYPAAPR